jgi:predicted Zn-ribbon and HTH transcriptional regulator
MKKLLPPHDPVEAMGEAYELLLENALKKAHQSGAAVHQMIAAVRGDIVALSKFGDDEAAKLEEYVKRDMIDAARYLDKTGKDLEGWLGYDVALIKREFRELFSEAADQTTIELNQLKQQAENAGYHSGELVGLGTLVCDQCGEKLRFYKPSHIPACPKCNSTHFHRQNFE